jgi:mannonate dehydratase
MSKLEERPDGAARLSRRDLAKLALGAAVGAIGAGGLGTANPASAAVRSQPPGIKLCQAASLKPTPEDLLFLKQLGFEYVFCNASEPMTVDEMLVVKKTYADVGITLDNLRHFSGGSGQKDLNALLLDLPERPQAIDNMKTWIRNVGNAGFYYTGGTLSITGGWRSGMTDTRGAPVPEFDENSPNVHSGYNASNPSKMRDMLLFGRKYTYDEIIDNFHKYFGGEIVPVLEEEGVAIAFHPDDPPTYAELGGVARIFGTFKQINKVFEAAHDSPNVGLMMCIGTWLEGGDRMGMDVDAAIRYFWKRNKFWEVHFRNVSAPEPDFKEVFMDNGYYPLFNSMKTLVQIGYNHTVNLDHTPQMVGAPYAYTSYAMGYMKACLQQAQSEVRR